MKLVTHRYHGAEQLAIVNNNKLYNLQSIDPSFPSTMKVFLEQWDTYIEKAKLADFGREFLDFACSIKVVADFQEALTHIASHSSRHSEAIITSDEEEANYFLSAVDAAAVYWNASTRFTDGGEFGLGAEIGISTQKLHARGPFALEKLVTEKWIGIGQGQTR